MLGLDTNVLVRYLVRDDEAQFEKASRLIKREIGVGEAVFVSLPVLLETEWVLRSQPDLIMMGQTPLDPLQRRPGWPQLAAVKHNRVCQFTAEQGDVLVRPGPRMGEAAWLMAQCAQRSWKP